MNTLYLTQAERIVYDKLPANVRTGWEVKTETGTSYETAYELMVRANMADLSEYPELAQMAKDMAAGKNVDPAALKHMPDTVIPEVLFAIGAVGISMLMKELLALATNDEDVQSLAGFSFFRHDILEANASVPKA